MSSVSSLLSRGKSAGIVHARTAAQDLGWAIELRSRGDRASMRQLAQSFRRDLALTRQILETESETITYELRLQRLESARPPAVVVVCAWCPAGPAEAAEAERRGYRVSHGICKACQQKQLRDITADSFAPVCRRAA